ncbi:DUF317 domain-containing protein [Peterkaempfera griseoplana]|uniref:DUF317 domain-containing protein n=1 Tax=Peterkaempfera griseoplana TaxID=66896 RepID=UPI0006E1D0FA|nr:DUF317 domain-containing protein [Peterkaempfera griseoplana]
MPAPALSASPPDDARSLLVCSGEPYLVTDLLTAHDWPIVIDHQAAIHAARPDGGLYLGYLPDSNRDAGSGRWLLAACGTAEQRGWTLPFPPQTPSSCVAAFVRALLTSEATP